MKCMIYQIVFVVLVSVQARKEPRVYDHLGDKLYAKHKADLKKALKSAKLLNNDGGSLVVVAPKLDANERLFDAAKMGNITEVKELLANGANANKRFAYGDTALMRASWKGYTAIVKLLAEKMVYIYVYIYRLSYIIFHCQHPSFIYLTGECRREE